MPTISFLYLKLNLEKTTEYRWTKTVQTQSKKNIEILVL